MNLSIGVYGTYNGWNVPLTSAEKEKEQEQRELMGLEDPAGKSGVVGEASKDGRPAIWKQDPTGLEHPVGQKNPVEEKNPAGKKNPGEECETCKKRKYQDGSDEMVSFKSAAHISPESAAARVRAHEQEHVSNAYKKAAENDGKVISASVSIQTAVCPECGRTYVSGGTTHTQIKYYNEENPYQKGLKTADQVKYSGMNMDYAV